MINKSVVSKRAIGRGQAVASSVAVSSGPPAPATGALTSVAGSASSVQLLAANAARKGATIFNDSTALLYVALADTTASASVFTQRLFPNGHWELPVSQGGVYTGKIVGIWASATGNARVTELT